MELENVSAQFSFLEETLFSHEFQRLELDSLRLECFEVTHFQKKISAREIQKITEWKKNTKAKIRIPENRFLIDEKVLNQLKY